MMMNPSLILFMICLATSVFIVLSSPSLLFSWVGLELNTLAFIPLILNNSNKTSSESAIKYFLTQTLASIIFLISTMLPLDSYLSQILIIMSMMIKLGAAPFHSWLPSMVEAMSWISLLILLTIQKINPLLILINPQPSMDFMYLPVWLSLIVGSFMGLIQTQLRSLLTYSSINHMGWFLVAWMHSNYLLIIYFITYMIMLTPITLLFSKMNSFHLNHLTNMPVSTKIQFLTFMLFLSLGGLPPFFGFLPKWAIIQEMLLMGDSLETCFLMILTSLITLYFYLRMTFSAFILSNSKWININFMNKETKMDTLFLMFSSISILGLSLAFVS
nr:NADH dehydrogenase subunit 2 [Moina macrocopa]